MKPQVTHRQAPAPSIAPSSPALGPGPSRPVRRPVQASHVAPPCGWFRAMARAAAPCSDRDGFSRAERPPHASGDCPGPG